jgi:hypothetical protein
MNCEKVMEMLSLYIDNQLDEKETREIEKHLKNCEKCSREYEDLLTIKKLLSETPKVELPMNFKEELHRKLVESSIEENSEIIDFKEKSEKVRNKKKYNWKILSGIAAGILITVVSVSSLINNNFETKEYAKMESEGASPQQAMPFNVAMDEPKSSDIATKEEPMESHRKAELNTDKMEFASEHRGLENKKEKTAENMGITPQKVIISGHINLQIADYDAIYNKIVNKVIAKGGFVQNSYTSYKDLGTNARERDLKNGSMVLRIPKTEFQNMFDDIRPMGIVTDENINSNDITIQYMEILDSRNNLGLEEKKLKEALDNTKDENEVSDINEKLDSVALEIERLSEEVLALDDLEVLSTLEIYLDEVK